MQQKANQKHYCNTLLSFGFKYQHLIGKLHYSTSKTLQTAPFLFRKSWVQIIAPTGTKIKISKVGVGERQLQKKVLLPFLK